MDGQTDGWTDTTKHIISLLFCREPVSEISPFYVAQTIKGAKMLKRLPKSHICARNGLKYAFSFTWF